MPRSALSEPSLPARSNGSGPAALAPVDPRQALRWGERQHDRWLERWIRSTEDLARLRYSHRMLDAVIEEVDGRQIRVGNQWLTDYASCNYLGLDLDREIIAAIPEYLDRWGTHPSWSRLLGSPVLYEEIEDRLTALLGCEDSLVLPTITHIHMSVIPVLAGGGTVFLDSRAHKTIYDGCAFAEARGATVERFAHEDLDQLEALLCDPSWRRPGTICIDGVNSMTGNAPDLAAFAALARAQDAILYVDDAHGFGVIGERSQKEPCDYGVRGNSIVRHVAESYENIVLVGGFSKAYSSLLAFIACPTALKQVLKTAAPPYLYSGPSPVASLATVLEGLRVNDARGDQLRGKLHHLTRRVLDRLDELGVCTPNHSGFPIIEVPLADPDSIDEVGDLLFDRGIYVTMAVYPLVPREEVGFRLQLTAANTDEQVDHLCKVLGEVAQRFKLHGRPAE
ncbi:MAG TPA: pyridoxal phosphate-dependent aminotransferase family protein [Solirubrobacteraceae bacterium]|nr:pyridoxal phosphate-dependent aminotransferase family protein [Solirubrobacteraceae bacterium]